MTTVLVIRIVAIALGVALFATAALLDFRHGLKPYATGKQRSATFYDDAKVFALRIAAVGIVFAALFSWVIGNHLGPAPR